MHVPLPALIDLLHGAADGALATHSLQLPGYPYVSAVPFVPDASHRPLFLLSLLAEHTHNLLADPRASLVISEPGGQSVLQRARATLIGDCVELALSDAEVARYLRYQPEAQQYLSLGDFRWFRMQPERARFVGGFGRMGWLEASDLDVAPLARLDEQQFEAQVSSTLAAGVRFLGVDPYGVDIESNGQRQRRSFDSPVADTDAAVRAFSRLAA